jgi:WbqC-like protein family
LPLIKAPQGVLIRDLQFPPHAAELLARRLRSFPALKEVPGAAEPIVRALLDVTGTPLTYIERLLHRITTYLDLPWNVIRSSSLEISDSFRGQDRILEIARRLGARRYVNAPGGRSLYGQRAFSEAGIELSFLPEYPGPHSSILSRILLEDQASLTTEIRRAARPC